MFVSRDPGCIETLQSGTDVQSIFAELTGTKDLLTVVNPTKMQVPAVGQQWLLYKLHGYVFMMFYFTQT